MVYRVLNGNGKTDWIESESDPEVTAEGSLRFFKYVNGVLRTHKMYAMNCWREVAIEEPENK